MCYFFVFCWQRPRGAKKGILSPKKKSFTFNTKMKLIFRQLTLSFSKQNPPKGVMPEVLITENKTDAHSPTKNNKKNRLESRIFFFCSTDPPP